MSRRILLAVAAAVTVVVAALALQRWSNRAPEAPAAVPGSAAAVEATDVEPGFTLSIRVESPIYRAGEPVQVRAWLTYAGPKIQEKLTGSGSGLILFSWEQLDRERRHQAWVATSDCAPYSIDRGQPMAVAFAKSGGFSADDPDADFWRRYFADPALRLPAGRYRIHAQTDFYVGACGVPEHRLDASLEILVVT